jgi:hypothetical protein
LAIGLISALVVGFAGCAGTTGIPSSACRVAELDLVIDAGAEGDGFIAVGGLAVGSDGTAYVLDAGEGSLIAFAPEGDEIWRVGGVDAGLEEFADPTGLHRVGEMLAFRDRVERRLSFWTETGESAGLLYLDSLGRSGSADWAVSLGGGRVVAALLGDHTPTEFDPPMGALIIASGGSQVVDTLASFEMPAPQWLELPGYEIPISAPFAPHPLFVSSPDGVIAFATGDEYRIQLYAADGAPWAEIRGADEAPAVTAPDRRAFGRLLPDTLMAGQLVFPASHPAITLLATTADGNLLARTSWTQRDQVRWDRWTLEGEYQDSFLLPESISLVSGVGNLIYGRAVDEVGAHHIEIYRLTGGATCPGPIAYSPAGPGRDDRDEP